MAPFNNVVTSEHELREMLGVPASRSMLKERPTLDAHFRAFIARSPFLLMATSSANGTCDVSPKGDAPGFVLILDDHRLVIPDRPGNKRFDGMKNLLTNPHIGLIFLVPGREETLRVNGRAWITRDPELLGRCTAQGKTPHLAIGVEVEQCFLALRQSLPSFETVGARRMARVRCTALNGAGAVRPDSTGGRHDPGLRLRDGGAEPEAVVLMNRTIA